MNQKFKSKVSFLFIVFIALIFFGPFVFESFRGSFGEHFLSGLIFLTILFVLIVYNLLTTHYSIVGDTLKIRSGFVYFKDINIKDITEVKSTNSIMSAPAASFDRIDIFYKKYSSVTISPNDKLTLIERLKKINPDIKSNL